MKITFIGGGNMAGALIGGLLNNGFPPASIMVVDISSETRERLEKSFRVACFAAPTAEALDCDALLFAVKPQHLREACLQLRPYIQTQLVISAAAGVRLADLSRWLGGYKCLVRVMPNTPALIGAGVTGLCAMPEVSEAERVGAERVMQAVGSTLWVANEAQINAVTAISGSGPAYLFLFLESLQEAAKQLGFSPKQGRQLALETVLGAAKLALQSEDAPSILRERVTSKGGTTEAALNIMHAHGLKETIVDAALAAYQRAGELGELLGKD